MPKSDTPLTDRFKGYKAIFFNGTLKKSPEPSHTDGLIDASRTLMEKLGVEVEVIRTIDTAIATGVYPDMREYGWETDEWPAIYERVTQADVVILAGPIWLGDNSSETKKIVERLYAQSSDVNDEGQYAFYGKAAGVLLDGNEDGIKHCAMNLLYSLQHVGFSIPPQADAGWIGEVGPGPSYLDEGSGGPENDFTNRNITFMTYNVLHMAKLLKDNGGFPALGNIPGEWDDGDHSGYENPEYR